jgi:hypothetical protein
MSSYYVYELTDPRDGLPFYVGKGVRARIHQHEREARAGGDTAKCQRIREIEAAGLEVGKRYVRWFSDEQAAYDFEAEHIAALGPETLTNIAAGGGTPRLCGKSDDAEVASACAEFINRTRNGAIEAIIVAGEVLDLRPILVDYKNRLREFTQKHGLEWVNKRTAKFGVLVQ